MRGKKTTQKLIITFVTLFLYQWGTAIPLSGVDQLALKKSLFNLDPKNSLLQLLALYSDGGSTLLSPFSLGIIPYINASIILDFLTTSVPSLEKLQTEEGETGKQKLNFYKKLLTFVFATIQSGFAIRYLEPYLYESQSITNSLLLGELVSGSMIIIWLCNLIDKKGIGNGTSLLILANILSAIIRNSSSFSYLLQAQQFAQLGLDCTFLLLFIIFICISQTARVSVPLVSARQLAFLQTLEKTSLNNKIEENIRPNESGLSIRLNQAGVFPIIIVSSLMPFLSFFGNKLGVNFSFFYYLLLVGFNYLYTIIFWDPEKISEQLRKASVSIVNISPGKETINYLEKTVQATSILGGILLSAIVFIYEQTKGIYKESFLNQLNVTSLIIVIGVACEFQKTIRLLYKTNFNEKRK